LTTAIDCTPEHHRRWLRRSASNGTAIGLRGSRVIDERLDAKVDCGPLDRAS
jgi:hypothetical protein